MDTNAAAADPTAVVRRRVAAAVIDLLLVGGVSLVIWQTQARYVDAPGQTCSDLREAADDIAQCIQIGDSLYYVEGVGRSTLVSLGMLVVSLGVLVVLQGLRGITPGKALTGLRCVDELGRPPGVGRAAVRWLLLLVDSAPWVVPYLVGFMCVLTSSGHRRIGDMAAKTYVVRKDAAGSPPFALEGAAGVDGEWTEGPHWDEQRGAYIHWDPYTRTWLQWDESEQRWGPVP